MPFDAYIICATPRTGSTLLCDLLTATGVAGRPASYYRRQSIANWAGRLDVPPGEGGDFNRAYLAAVRRYGGAGTGLFGLRLMWESVPELSGRLASVFPERLTDAARFERAFDKPLYVHLSRRDKIAQAVSRLKAEQTGLWHVAPDGTERERSAPPRIAVYDPTRLAELVAETESHSAGWNGWFAAQRIAPIRLIYEELSADSRGVLARVLSALGRDPQNSLTAAARSAKMADAESLSWSARFRAERNR